MNPLLIMALLIPLVIAIGCSKQESGKSQDATEEAAHDPDKEGRQAGICKEHGVLEAVCTKCNPKLAPIFKVKGDWCAEHDLPESVCPICHPERGGRPTSNVADDGAPADGTKVILKTKDIARLAGIMTTKAVPGLAAAELVASVVINYDASRVAQVEARAPGVVKQVSASIGTRVSAGAPLAIIESALLTSDQLRLTAARSRVQTAESNYRREAELEKKGISAKKEVEAAHQDLNEAMAELESIRASLREVGAKNGSAGCYIVKAPVSGVITQQTISTGRYVDSRASLFEIVDTSSMWAEVALPEVQLDTIKAGTAVVITIDSLAGHKFRGTIAHIAPLVDSQTRTAKARVRLDNPKGLLMANMYGQARITVGGLKSSSAVPRDAIQRVKSVKFAFVRVAPNEYEARRILVASGYGGSDLVEIASGVEIGEDVAVAGSFFLKTETLKDSIGAGCCEVDKK